MRPRPISLFISIAALTVQSLGVATPALAATPVDVVFSSTGAEQTWVVPSGVSSIHVVLVGGRGGRAGGFGHRVDGDLAVTAGETIYVEVAGNGAVGGTAGAFNGGGVPGDDSAGGGGGASDVRTTSRGGSGSLDSRLIVAAGGGGSSACDGGDAGSSGQTCPGGAGGGGAGTASGGGSGGVGVSGGLAGLDGILGVGGNGGSSSPGGGAGGGGNYGGGGGGSAQSVCCGGGGGGGSSYTGAATNSSVAVDSTGTPSITLTYTPPSPTTGTVDATVTMAQSVVCLEVSTGSIDFGTRQFGDTGVAASPQVTVANCGGISESVLAHGTDATGAGPTTWTLNDTGTCAGGTLATNDYGLALERQDTLDSVRLSSANKTLQTLGNGSSVDELARIDTPCPGSNGAGVQMSMQIVFVATE